MSGPDIFLSYARTDRATARMFAEAFADEGFTVWWDASLHSGETFDEVIEQKLRDAQAVVVLWSPRSVASRWVRAEATQADRRHKLAPAIIEPCDRPIIFELTHAADLCDWDGDATDIHWRTFMDDLRRLIDAGSDREIPTTARPAARHRPHATDRGERDHTISRRPLRPGHEEVILASGRSREQTSSAEPRGRAHPRTEADPHTEVHCLELDDGDLGEELFVVETSGMKIGRSAPADIVLSHKSISREHCMVGLANDELILTDLNSTNGTFIDDVRIKRATIVPLGSVVRIGHVTLKHAVHTRAEAKQRGSPAGTNKPGGLQAGRIAATS